MSTLTSVPLDVIKPARGRLGAPSARLVDHLLAGIPTLWLALFFLAPLGFTVVFSFGRNIFGGVELAFTLDNYRTALSGFYGATFIRTIIFAASASALCLAVAYPVAYFIARHTSRHRVLAIVLILIPYFSSFLIRVMSLHMLMSRDGFAEAVLNVLNLHSGPLDVLDTQTAVFIGMVYAYLPIAIVPLYVVLDRIPRPLLEASRDLGASRLETFLFVTLPMSRPGIATAVLLTAVPMLGEMVIPKLLGGSRGVLMGQALSSQYLQSQNYPLGSAMAVLILLAIAVIVAGLARLTKGFAEVGQ
ncbi:ABC transporter permease [Kaistia dalseonensis]|uniref:Spermidine/putrescine transport system permease protein n=1 Tax=Kaistia dalseonensis TaxID=410840 RepID=A0ABU0H8J4_9HYPH|nr:ABC transporter permease [Kaistia dalseonensis]MCX5495586.1 ABC transporter permease [Kaistia dalseonensis]MDQ0438178.1 spermidine/putrescine transport system permease protein [Kaistia dalseonensis]